MKLKKFKKILASILVATCVISSLGVTALTAKAEESEEVQMNEPPIIEEEDIINWSNADGGTSVQASMRVNTPSKADIVQYFAQHNILHTYNTVYDEQPSASIPYSLGKVSNGTLNEALELLNAVRYVAGIGANVILNEQYNELAQAAALVNAANGGGLSHSPERPNGMDDELYALGYMGASSSNISAGRREFGSNIIAGWMYDGDASNIDRVGHRRWILNPRMGQVGFGMVEAPNSRYRTYSAMYAFDRSSADDYYGVTWPAQTMPVEFFGDYYPWSISMGYVVDGNAVSVCVRDIETGKEWNLFNGSPEGYFNVDNGGYGQQGCIIFRPDGISCAEGKKYEVTVTGLPEKFSYVVDFFSVANTYMGDVNTELHNFSYNNSSHYLSGQIVVVEWVDVDGDGVKESTVPKYAPKMVFASTDGREEIEVFVTPTGTNTYYFDRLIEGLTPGKEYVFYVTSGDPNNIGEYTTVPVYTGTSGIGSSGTLGMIGHQRIQFKTAPNGTLLLYGTDPDQPYVGNVNSLLKYVECTKSNLGNFVSGNIIITEWIDDESTVPLTTPIMSFDSYDGTETNEVFMQCLDGTNTYYFDRNLTEGLNVKKEYIFRITLTEENNVSERKSMVATTNEMDSKEGIFWETDSQIVMYKTVWADGDNQLRIYAVNK